MTNNNWIAPCGLWCGACGIGQAHAQNNDKLKEKLAPIYGCRPEDLVCEGCRSDVRFAFCQSCAIRSCADEKGLQGCFLCADFPCERIEGFAFPAARQVMLRAVPQWRELGTEKWLQAEAARYSCPQCHARLMRRQTRCPQCKQPVSPDQQ